MKTINQKRKSENLESKVSIPTKKNFANINSIVWNSKRRYK
jgi:hypothetical protein